MMTRWKLLSAVAVAIMGCAGDGGGYGNSLIGPQILSLSTYSGKVGDSIQVVGTGFPSNDEARVDLHWRGTYVHGGTMENVNAVMLGDFTDANTVNIAYLGPFTVPFSRTGDQAGTFQGTITPVITYDDPSLGRKEGTPFDVRFEVEPSIIITNLQPIDAQCSRPVRRLLGGFAYRIGVRAVGFRPTNFTYQFLGLPNTGDRLLVRHPANGMTDQAGDSFAFVLDPVTSEDQRGYKTTLVVSSLDDRGVAHEIRVVLTVHRAFEAVYDGSAKVAQIYAPVQVAHCQSGSLGGAAYNFTESQTETRTRQLTVSFDQSWAQMVQNSKATGHTETNGNRFDTSNSDTVGWTTNTQTKTQGETSIGAIVKVALQAHYVQDKGFSGSSTQGRSVGQDHSEQDTISESVTSGESYALSRGNSEFFNVSSADQKSSSITATIFAGHFGVLYRQTTRLVRNVRLISYNLCGEPREAGTTNVMDWLWGSDVAQGIDCNPAPPSQLPPARCLIGPCD